MVVKFAEKDICSVESQIGNSDKDNFFAKQFESNFGSAIPWKKQILTAKE